MTIASDNFDSFGALLHKFRKRRHLTQEQLANVVDMHRQAIIRWERGEVLPASKAIVLELVRHLHLNNQEARDLLDASLTAPTPIWSVPFPRNLFFTGREKILETLHQSMDVDRMVTITRSYALQGLGGVGKTQIALEYAYRHALEYHAIFWIEAGTRERALVSLQRIAKLLHLSEQAATDPQRVVETVRRWLGHHDRWLLIWDDLDDLELPCNLLSPTRQGTFLFTTRRQTLGTLAWGIDIPPMEHEEGTLLLFRRAKMLGLETMSEQAHRLAECLPADYAVASKLVTMLGGLPLALDQAGAYLEETGCSLTDYLQHYKQSRALLLDRRGGPGGGHPMSVTATFQLAHKQVIQEHKGAADLLYICAFLQAEAIPEEIFPGGGVHLGPTLTPLVNDPTQFGLALAVLRNLSLVQRQAEMHTLAIHPLLQVVLRELMEQYEEYIWSKCVIRMVHAVFPEGDFVIREQCERYLPHALACVPLITLVGKELPEAGELLQRVGHFLLLCGRLEDAKPLLEQAVKYGEQYYGPLHPVLIPRLAYLAELLWRLEKYAPAEALLSRALAIGEEHLEPTQIQLADTLNMLAVIYLDQEKYAQAEPLFQRALHIQEVTLGLEHPDITFSLYGLATLYAEQSKCEQANALLQRVQHICQQGQGVSFWEAVRKKGGQLGALPHE